MNYSAYKKLNAAKKELFDTRQQMNTTSAQDEFSKWAKLRRKVDKLTGEVDEQSMFQVLTQISSFRRGSSFSQSCSRVLCLS